MTQYIPGLVLDQPCF